MKTKHQLRPTPLFSTIIQIIVSVLIFFIILIEEESLPLVIFTGYAFAMYLLFLMLDKEWYNEILSGICKYRICKEKVSEEDIYYLQSKPLLLPFLPWKGEVYESFAYKEGFDDYLCENHFKTIEEALKCKNNLAINNKVRKLFLIKKIEVMI